MFEVYYYEPGFIAAIKLRCVAHLYVLSFIRQVINLLNS